MRKVKVYEYPKCSTCKKALKFLTGRNVEYEKVDITENPPTRAEIEKMLGHYDGDVRKLFNTSGVVYREMALGDKLKSMADSDALKLLSGNGRLIKRPFVLHAKGGLVGFKEAEWDEAFD